MIDESQKELRVDKSSDSCGNFWPSVDVLVKTVHVIDLRVASQRQFQTARDHKDKMSIAEYKR